MVHGHLHSRLLGAHPQPHRQTQQPPTPTMDSDSSLSSPPSTDDEMAKVVAPVKAPAATPQKKKKKNGTILSFFKSPSPVRKKRPASPPHEPVSEDNPDIAVRTGRVDRVVARRGRVLHALDLCASPRLTFYTSVHCNVPVTLHRCLSAQDTALWTSGPGAGRCGRHAVAPGRVAALRSPRVAPQSQEACRVSNP